MAFPSVPLRRRDVLQGLLAAFPLALLRPTPVQALGGTLPPLGEPAPPFRLPASGAGDVQELGLEDFAGRWLVLYFYPRDFTSGCTLEARGFQQDLPLFEEAGAAVVGVSADDGASHASFCSSEGLGFPLLSDGSGEVSRRYGSWISPFSQRHTFLVDPQGVLQARWTAVRPAGHSQEVLAVLRDLQQTSASGI